MHKKVLLKTYIRYIPFKFLKFTLLGTLELEIYIQFIYIHFKLNNTIFNFFLIDMFPD